MDIPSDLSLEGKVAIVCGGGTSGNGIGNGRAASILLAKAGAKVAVVDKTFKSAKSTTEIIREFGGTSYPIEADVRNEPD